MKGDCHAIFTEKLGSGSDYRIQADHYLLSRFEEWKSNCKYLTELVMVLNWKIYEHYGTDNEKAELYDKLWREADAWACENLKGDDLNYFYETTD